MSNIDVQKIMDLPVYEVKNIVDRLAVEKGPSVTFQQAISSDDTKDLLFKIDEILSRQYNVADTLEKQNEDVVNMMKEYREEAIRLDYNQAKMLRDLAKKRAKELTEKDYEERGRVAIINVIHGDIKRRFGIPGNDYSKVLKPNFHDVYEKIRTWEPNAEAKKKLKKYEAKSEQTTIF